MTRTPIENQNINILQLLFGTGIIGISLLLLRRMYSWLHNLWILSRYPLINPGNDGSRPKPFLDTLHEGIQKSNGGPFRIKDVFTEKIMLPPKYIDDMKNRDELDFHGFIAKDFFADYPGFEPFATSGEQRIFQDAVRNRLSQALSLTIVPVAEQSLNVINQAFGDPIEWKQAALFPGILGCISRLNNLVFLGDRFLNNEEWTRISLNYSVHAFLAAQRLNSFPALARPIIHWFLPECKQIRHDLKQAREIIAPEVQRRLSEMQENGGKPRRKILDSIDWFVASAKGQPFDFSNAEMQLAMAAAHTTTNTFCFAFFDLLEHPQYLKPLREEIISVYSEAGEWKQTSLYNLRLMDSFLKESMRCHPHGDYNLPRLATKSFTLSDGNIIPEGVQVGIGPTMMQDPNIWPNPHVFDGYRFLNLRNQSDNEHKYQAVTTSCETTGFGHGKHSCPGRFYATNLMKILMAHLIMYYDWKLPNGVVSVKHDTYEWRHSPSSKQTVFFRKRVPEIDISATQRV